MPSSSDANLTTADPVLDSSMPEAEPRLSELADLVRAYNAVTEKLQRSHETLSAEVARLRGELATADAQLQRSKRLSALGEMAAGIAHEVRNPLAAIQLYAEMVTEDLASALDQPTVNQSESNQQPIESSLDNTRKIAEAVRGLTAIVNDVLTFARQANPEPKPSSLEDLIQKTLVAHQPAIDEFDIDVKVSIKADIATLDAGLMQQALLNLVRNAVDAMQQSGKRQLAVSTWTEQDDLLIEVRDTGPGIDQADVDRIFNPFFTTRNTGTGLGLAIVHRIVDAHQGTVTVHHDEGAVFRMTLPLNPAADDALLQETLDPSKQPLLDPVVTSNTPSSPSTAGLAL